MEEYSDGLWNSKRMNSDGLPERGRPGPHLPPVKPRREHTTTTFPPRGLSKSIESSCTSRGTEPVMNEPANGHHFGGLSAPGATTGLSQPACEWEKRTPIHSALHSWFARKLARSSGVTNLVGPQLAIRLLLVRPPPWR